MNYKIKNKLFLLLVQMPARKTGTIYNFFNRLFGSSEKGASGSSSPSQLRSPAEPEKALSSSISPSNSTELSQLGKVAGFVQDQECYQMSGWMLPDPGATEGTGKGDGNASETSIPVPVHCAPLSDKESANAKEQCFNTECEEPRDGSAFSNIFARFM